MVKRTNEYSKAFLEFTQNIREIGLLLRLIPSINEQITSKTKTDLANALYRGIVVLLSSHLERYCEAVVVEGVDVLNSTNLNRDKIPKGIQLLQVSDPIDQAYQIKDPNKINQKSELMRKIAQDLVWFWDSSRTVNSMSGEILIKAFSNPLPNRIDELFVHFDINKITHNACIRDPITSERGLIRAKVTELVGKRNAIAHTGMTSDLGMENIQDYLRCTCKLVRYIDSLFGDTLEGIIGKWPWNSL